MKSKAILACLAILFATSYNAQAQDEPKYMRSSIYTVLVKSDKENARLDEEIEHPNLVMGLIDAGKDIGKSFGSMFKGNKKEEPKEAPAEEAPEKTNVRSKVPQEEFLKIPIPENFNDHNLAERVIELDPIVLGLSEKEIEDADVAISGKKSGGKKFLGGLGKVAGSVMGGKEGSEIIRIDTVSKQIPAALNKYFADNHVAEQLVAKWFRVDGTDTWDKDLKLIHDRGLSNASAQDLKLVDENILAGRGLDLIDKTFVVAVNLRFRSDKAILAEAQQLADVAGSMFGDIGLLASQAAGAIAGYAVGNGYSVQANTYLYQLKWNDELANKFKTNIYDTNASLQDLVNLGICELIPRGKASGKAHKRQSLYNKRSESELVGIATAQAIDNAISKLQEKVEDFRIVTPISEVGQDGIVYAKIGTKEDLKKDDEYEILEAREDAKTGKIEYKSVGKVKVVDKQIWENRYGMDKVIEEMKGDEAQKTKDAMALGQTAFKGAKKGQDYTGYLLRLKKKK